MKLTPAKVWDEKTWPGGNSSWTTPLNPVFEVLQRSSSSCAPLATLESWYVLAGFLTIAAWFCLGYVGFMAALRNISAPCTCHGDSYCASHRRSKRRHNQVQWIKWLYCRRCLLENNHSVDQTREMNRLCLVFGHTHQPHQQWFLHMRTSDICINHKVVYSSSRCHTPPTNWKVRLLCWPNSLILRKPIRAPL